MRLKDIIAEIEEIKFEGDPDIEISGLAYDSRRVKSGDLFFCIRGFKTDGHEYAGRAQEAGASAVMVEEVMPDLSITQVVVEDTRVGMPRAASAFYGHPTRKMRLVGVTGTNGKTTTTYMIDSIFKSSGYKTGLIGTIEYRIGDEVFAVERTTPESLDIQRLFASMVDAGVEAVSIEVSSHAIDLARVEACDFDVLVFTNLSREHLDYHGTMEEYFKVKRRMFERTSGRDVVHVINVDDQFGRRIIEETGSRHIRFSNKDKVEVYGTNIEAREDGSTFELHVPGAQTSVALRLPGMFNIHNALAAAGVAYSQGIGINVIKVGLEALAAVPGRFERIDCGQGFSVIVDYAHTPDSLEKALIAAREITTGRLITVFGCGGDRDRGKRPLMGRIGTQLSDYAILTSDNPRSEEPGKIIEEIAEGARALNGNGYHIIEDRRLAIKEAIACAGNGDTVIIAGKGHEGGQEIKGEKMTFDDRDVARGCLEELKG